MSYHPYLQLQVGQPDAGYPITLVPPEHLMQMTYKSTFGGLSTLDFQLVDPTFEVVEELLILSDTRSLPIFARFGYLDEFNQIAGGWIQARLMNYLPRFTTRGMEITASTLIDVRDKVVEIETKAYSGKISQVVEQIAVDLDVDAEIEETDDDENEVYNVSPLGSKTPRLWSVKNKSLIRYLQDNLAPKARSKSGKGNYQAYITGTRSRSRKPLLHFHTKEYPTCAARTSSRKLTYLLGKQDVVLEFSPNYDSSLLGKVGAGGLVMRTYDPTTKRYVVGVHNILTNPEEVSVGSGEKTNAKVVSAGDPEDDKNSGGVHLVRGARLEEAEAKSRNLWSTLLAASFTASITLAGLPELSSLEANELLDIEVLIPNTKASGPAFKSHWSSGLYLVTEVSHEIATSYTISCELQRDRSSVGAEESRLSRLAS